MDCISDQAQATIVSCDIVGHGNESKHSRQVVLIKELNEAVRESIDQCNRKHAIWASGGDGGHVAFFTDAGDIEAIALIRRLRDWARRQAIQLRVTAHRGTVSTIEGADGRKQLVGEGINLSGSLVNFGLPQTVIVSCTFRDHFKKLIEKGIPLPALEFRDERVVYLKHFAAHNLCLLSFSDDLPGSWSFERSDQRKLQEACANGNPWQMIYYVKRLLQVDSNDPQALRALNEIEPGSLIFTPKSRPVIHPLLGVIPRPALLRLLQASELIEREDGDIICRRFDTGDSMFIVLKGEIGVIARVQTDEADCPKPADIRIGEGGIVGELALALNRPRTATLQVVGPSALLGISYIALKALLEREGRKSRLRINFDRFMEERIFEHLCRQTPYLSLSHCDEDRASAPDPWDRLIDGAEPFEIESEQLWQLSFGSKVNLPDGGSLNLSRDGLYILASGKLVENSVSHSNQKQLNGQKFDIIFASIPGEVISVDRKYKITPDRRITVIWISTKALIDYAQDYYRDIIERIRKRLASQMIYDAFISYARENEELAIRWKEALENAGLKIFMNTPEQLKFFEPEIDFALAESRVLLPIISRAARGTEWVKKEIAKRKEIFDENHANILPIETEYRLADDMAVGFTTEYAGERESDKERETMNMVIEKICDVRDGKASYPYLMYPKSLSDRLK